MYFTGTSRFKASGLRSNAQTSTDAGPRDFKLRRSQDSVSPESMMSSTSNTSRPAMSRSRSFMMRTTPEDDVAPPYDDTAMKSIVTIADVSARDRSAMTMQAPLSTPTSSTSRPA